MLATYIYPRLTISLCNTCIYVWVDLSLSLSLYIYMVSFMFVLYLTWIHLIFSHSGYLIYDTDTIYMSSVFSFSIELELTHTIIVVSGVQHSDSVKTLVLLQAECWVSKNATRPQGYCCTANNGYRWVQMKGDFYRISRRRGEWWDNLKLEMVSWAEKSNSTLVCSDLCPRISIPLLKEKIK